MLYVMHVMISALTVESFDAFTFPVRYKLHPFQIDSHVVIAGQQKTPTQPSLSPRTENWVPKVQTNIYWRLKNPA